MSLNKNLSVFGRYVLANGNISNTTSLQVTAKDFFYPDGSPVGVQDGLTYAINITGDADTVDGVEAVSLAANTYMQSYVATAITGKLDTTSYTAADVLAKLVTVDGTGTDLDADKLDGLQATAFLRTNANTSFSQTITGAGNINISGFITTSGTITGGTTDTLVIKDSAGSTLKTIRGV